MAQYFKIHLDNPEARLIAQSAAILRQGGLIVYPTDSSYALGCCIGEKVALDRIRHLRQLSPEHHMTLVCRDLSEISTYASIDNSAFRMMKSKTPGPYTFVLKAKRDVPRRLQHPKRRTIGIRIPDNPISLAILSALGESMISISLVLPGEVLPETDPEVINEKIGKQVDLIVDGAAGGLDFTTVLDLTGEEPSIIREGKGVSDLALS
ncbi:MAG: L-threonylcarbamoyladenylate synthase [Proteobacteria bacterium]|nr:L-threonylcarbamoyladenylate synthase [Pseudomonadota bacterium]